MSQAPVVTGGGPVPRNRGSSSKAVQLFDKPLRSAAQSREKVVPSERTRCKLSDDQLVWLLVSSSLEVRRRP